MDRRRRQVMVALGTLGLAVGIVLGAPPAGAGELRTAVALPSGEAALPTISAGWGQVVEGDIGIRTAAVEVSLSMPSDLTVTVTWSTDLAGAPPPPEPYRALLGVDYEAGSGTVSFAPGQTEAVAPVSVIGDLLVEGSEMVAIRLSSPVNATLLDTFPGVMVGTFGRATILDDDGDPPVLVPGQGRVLEGDSGDVVLQVPVTLTEPSVETVTVDWATIAGPGVEPPSPADPATDFDMASGTVTFAPRETRATVEITVHGDDVVEPDEWIVVAFGNATNALVGGFWGLGFGVIDDDDAPIVVPGGAAVVEGDAGDRELLVPVSLTEPSDQTVTVEWATVFGPGVLPPAPADPVADFDAAGGTVTFAPGQTEATVSVTVHGDTLVEPDEWVVIAFGNATNARIGGFWGLGFGVIGDDDGSA